VAKRVSLQGKGVELFFGGARGATEQPTAARAAAAESGLHADPPGASRQPAAPTRARTHAPIQTSPDSEDAIFRALAEKQRLASSTFRFQPEELEQLDEVFDELNRARPRRVSKNDIVRLGLLWVLRDYEANGGNSLVGRLLQRT
jgi:hypothetical protein